MVKKLKVYCLENRYFLKQTEEFISASYANQPSHPGAEADSRVVFCPSLVNQKEQSCLLGHTSLNIWHMVVKKPSEGKGLVRNWQLTSFLHM